MKEALHPPSASSVAATETLSMVTVTPFTASGCEPVRLAARAAGFGTSWHDSPVADASLLRLAHFPQVARTPMPKLRSRTPDWLNAAKVASLTGASPSERNMMYCCPAGARPSMESAMPIASS